MYSYHSVGPELERRKQQYTAKFVRPSPTAMSWSSRGSSVETTPRDCSDAPPRRCRTTAASNLNQLCRSNGMARTTAHQPSKRRRSGPVCITGLLSSSASCNRVCFSATQGAGDLPRGTATLTDSGCDLHSVIISEKEINQSL